MKKILIYNSGGGLGDSIQLFPLIISLKNHFKSSEFFYLGAHQNHFEGKLREFNINIKTLDLGIKYFGFRWWHYLVAKKRFHIKNQEKIDLIIDLQSKLRNTIILKRIPHKLFYSTTLKFQFCTNKNNYSSKNHLKNLDKFLNTKINLINFNYKNLSSEYKTEAKKLLPGNNYVGFSITQGNIYREKSWAVNNFIELANKLNERNKVPVFFIEKNQIQLINELKLNIPSALFPEEISKINCPALVTALSSRLELAISIDNGIMHMIGLANIPMIVLFGPTDSDKFAPKIDSIKILDSKKIYNSQNINKITIKDVLNLIKN